MQENYKLVFQQTLVGLQIETLIYPLNNTQLTIVSNLIYKSLNIQKYFRLIPSSKKETETRLLQHTKKIPNNE